MITAHGGAMHTGRNTQAFFDKMLEYKEIDAIEVDVRLFQNKLYLGHTYVPIRKQKRIELAYALRYCKEHNLKINCDLKRSGLVKHLVKLAKKLDVKENIYITGVVRIKDLPILDGLSVYVNDSFFVTKTGFVNAGNLQAIKNYIDGLDCEEIKGLNLSKTVVSQELLDKAKELDLKLSVYTVDDEKTLRLLMNAGVANITTNSVEMALDIRKELIGGI